MSHVKKRKQVDHVNNIMLKCHGVFTKNFTIFFRMQEKLKTCRIRIWEILDHPWEIKKGKVFKNGSSRIYGRQPFTWSIIEYFVPYICNIYIVTARASEFTQPYICYKFYSIKKNFLICKNVIWHTRTKFLRVLFHWKLNFHFKYS